ncbi:MULTISPECIES: acyl-CoA dehydrogenase family protein [Haloarcula]|uniref:acyl-CoA dehydrogenase family protein n=1 Tax=Haloarcula TaxID=2237 RepID=UPI0023EB8CBD|nr:acyl-CoA dehydrogenase family protein [Halomicroarcula sp. XH51]
MSSQHAGYGLSDEHRAVRQMVREFGENEIEPVAAAYDRSHEYPFEIIEQAAQLDLVAPSAPLEYGGAGMDTLSAAIVTEELWRADPGIGCAIGNNGFSTNVYLLTEYGDEWMCEEWLSKIVAGQAHDAIAVSEAAHGSNVAGIETRAEKDGDEWVIDGNKMWISNGTVADVVVVFAKTNPDAGHRGISAFLVPTDREGVRAEPIDDKLGIHAADLGEMLFDGVRVPEDHLIGEENKGFYYFMESLEDGRITVAAQAVGTMQAALDAAIEYAREREQFGQPIAEFQGVKHMIAEMATKVEVARGMVYRAATAVERGDDDATRLASMAKLFASERAVEVTDDAIQVHGGAGFVSDFPVERYYRDARITKIYEGTSEIQKNVIADQML